MLVVVGRESPPAREWGELLNQYLMKKNKSSGAADSTHHQGQLEVAQAHSSHAQIGRCDGCKRRLSQVCGSLMQSNGVLSREASELVRKVNVSEHSSVCKIYISARGF